MAVMEQTIIVTVGLNAIKCTTLTLAYNKTKVMWFLAKSAWS